MTKPKAQTEDNDSDRERTVRLPSGGTLTLSLDINLLKCGAEDRVFLFGIIDMLDAYEKARDEKVAAGTA